MKTLLLGLLALIVIGGGIFISVKNSATVLTSDTTYASGDKIPEKIVLKNGAKMTVNGDFHLTHSISCDGGPLFVTVKGNAVFDGSLTCNQGSASEDGAGTSITLVVSGSVSFGKDATVHSAGHVQIVNDPAKLLTTSAQVDAAYQEAGEPTGTGPRIGPFIEGGKVLSVKSLPRVASQASVSHSGFSLIPLAYAAEARDQNGNVVPSVVISGNWVIGQGGNPPSGLQVETPPKGVHKIILNFDFGKNGDVSIKDFHLVGPNGEDGVSDEDKTCNARGQDGKDAMRFRVDAGSINIDNFTIELGNGGNGGTATTKKDCDPGIAKGGNGGEAGNMKMTAEKDISIASMHIVPGVGGNGGGANAYGKDGTDGCPGKKGGDATATGGDGGKNKKELSAAGAVSGVENVTVDEVTGGYGGSASALPGKGGNGVGCNCGGGAGGKATATGGKGGDASVSAQGATANGATGGNGGDADSIGGMGGNGGQCPLKPSGGNGGKGGDAKSKEGQGGIGTTANGQAGTIKNEKGGDGGNGGDGCGPGGGGKGGSGRQPGKDGQPGKKQCPDTSNPQTANPPSGGQTTGTTGATGTTGGGSTSGGTNTTGTAGTSGGHTQTVQAISYQGKYIPVSELMVMTHSGCNNQPHWHSKPEAGGPVIATDGSTIIDPGPECGFGTVQGTPIVQVQASTR